MKIIKQSVELLTDTNQEKILKDIELIGRVCYKSEWLITDDSAETFVSRLIKSGHESVLEHKHLTVKFITDRGVTHELVRHRVASYTQESTRYVNYKEGIIAILPVEFDKGDISDESYIQWVKAMECAEEFYQTLVGKLNCVPQLARAVLPNSLKTEIMTTMNLREWRHVLKLRVSKRAHPQMRDLMNLTLALFKEKLPVVFEDIEEVK